MLEVPFNAIRLSLIPNIFLLSFEEIYGIGSHNFRKWRVYSHSKYQPIIKLDISMILTFCGTKVTTSKLSESLT